MSSSFIDGDATLPAMHPPIEKPSADASLMPSHRLSASRISRLLSSRLSSRATRKERFDGLAIRDNRVPSAIRFVRTRESRMNRRAIPIAYLSLNKTRVGSQSWTRRDLSYACSSYLIIIRVSEQSEREAVRYTEYLALSFRLYFSINSGTNILSSESLIASC